MNRLPTRAIAIAALALVFLGSAFLDFGQPIARGYISLLLGSLTLVALPELKQKETITSPVKGWIVYLFAALGAVLCLFIASTVGDKPAISGQWQAGLWTLGCACFIFAGGLWDWRRKAYPQLFEKSDWLWMSALACVATAARGLNLGIAPLGLVFDELEPLGDTVAIQHGVNHPAFSVDSFSHNGVFYHLHNLFVDRLGWLGFDLVQSGKIVSALAGGLSVAALYATARLLGTRPVAATAGVLLIFQGWHFLLTRLFYAYAGDLLWLSLSTSLLLVGLCSGRMAAFAGSAVTATLATAWLKTGVLAAPWALLLMLESRFQNKDERLGGARAFALWLAIFVVTAAPVATLIIGQPQARWRYQEVYSQRVEDLDKRNMPTWKGYMQGILNVANVLQVQDAQRSRHSPRPGMPLLDIVFSGLATVGFLWSVWNVRRNRLARVLLMGSMVFILPSIISYPEDAPAATSRRMAFCSLLVALMAAQGAAIVASRVLPQRARFGGMIGLACISALLNIHGMREWHCTSEYYWYDILGAHRPPLINVIRESAKIGPVLYYPNGNQYGGLELILKHYSNVKFITTTQEAREELRRQKSGVVTIILPWASPTYEPANDSPRWINDLSDVISPHQWSWGPPNALGISIYRMAKVTIPRQ